MYKSRQSYHDKWRTFVCSQQAVVGRLSVRRDCESRWDVFVAPQMQQQRSILLLGEALLVGALYFHSSDELDHLSGIIPARRETK